MFTWICPQCGREVPPSYTECPDCASRQQQPSALEATPNLPLPQVIEHRGGMPGWLLSLLFAVGFLAIGTGVFLSYRYFTSSKEAAQNTISLEKPALAATPAKPNVLTKYIEITGFRLTEDSKQNAQVQFLVVNHSGAEITDLSGTVTLTPRADKPEKQPVGTFAFKVSSLGPYESKELKATVQTHLRAYELPDWQYLRADLQISSP